MHLRAVSQGWLADHCYEPSHLYDGSEGELYNLNDDPDQIANLWDHPKHRETQQELKNLLYESLPEPRSPKLARVAPV